MGVVLTEGDAVLEVRGLRVAVRVPVVVRLIVDVLLPLRLPVLVRVDVVVFVMSRVRVADWLPSSTGFVGIAVGVGQAVVEVVGVVTVVCDTVDVTDGEPESEADPVEDLLGSADGVPEAVDDTDDVSDTDPEAEAEALGELVVAAETVWVAVGGGDTVPSAVAVLVRLCDAERVGAAESDGDRSAIVGAADRDADGERVEDGDGCDEREGADDAVA